MPDGRPIRILVVEDYLDTREMYVEFLALNGYDVIAAEDGLEALRIAQALRPDVVVLDIALPRMDGFSVLRRMRADPKLREVPVLTLSASVEEDYEDSALKAGATKALRKPCLPDELLAAIRVVVPAHAPRVV